MAKESPSGAQTLSLSRVWGVKNVDRIIILYPGETGSQRINNPANYSLPRLLLRLHETDGIPIFVLNLSQVNERYGNIEFFHFSLFNLLRVVSQCVQGGNTLIILQTHAYRSYAKVLRLLLPRARVLVRLGGVFHGAEFLNSKEFEFHSDSRMGYLRTVDMVICTADGTPVDLYMRKIGVQKDRYRKWLNGFPVIENHGGYDRLNQIVCIARLSPFKGLDYVLESYALARPLLVQEHKLVIVGDGPELKNLQRQAERLAIASDVVFVGDSYDVAKHLYSSKLVVTGLANNTVMEAIATNTPVITVELGEMLELYGHFSNVHFVDYPPGGCGRIDKKYMAKMAWDTAQKIAEVLNAYPPPYLIRGEARRDLASWDERIDKELNLYDSLFAGEFRSNRHSSVDW